VSATIPWDSYLIRTGIWSYPSHVVAGPTLFDIPLEEVFFFVVQTYNTTLLYLILSKPTFQPVYLRADSPTARTHWWFPKVAGQLFLVGAIVWAWRRVRENGPGTYTGLIVVWAGPVLLAQW
jgi:15-cis-phytoene synthase/lycopene beta-cyclase